MKAMSTETFIGNMRGPVIRRMDPDYDAVRSLYNGMIDKSPVMIASCTDVADVVTAVNFARESDLRVAIRGGGHNGPGLGSVDDGLMIDMGRACYCAEKYAEAVEAFSRITRPDY